MDNRALACTGCHGEFGVATAKGYFPRIAGKPAGYLLEQLRHFKSGTRRFDAMNRLVKSLPDDYLQQFANYFAQLDLPYPPPEPQRLSATQTKRALELVNHGDPALEVPSCKSCHGIALTGVQPAVPGLLGLPRDYLTAQLGAWQNHLRKAREPDCMATIVSRLSVQDMTALSGWLAAQALPASSGAVDISTHRQAVPSSPLKCGSDAFARSSPVNASTEMAQAHRADPNHAGRYLVRLGNCAACHRLPVDSLSEAAAADSPVSYGGGVAIETPFGKVFGSNISGSKSAGIGQWQPETFHRAMTRGISANGSPLNPVFPYQFFAGLRRDDTKAMLQWLKASPPIDRASPPHKLRFPYGTEIALSVWRWLYVDKAHGAEAPNTRITPNTSLQESFERGRYLVESVMHCNACHGERNFLGGFKQARRTGGQKLPADGGYAPSLDTAAEAGMAGWTLQEIKAFLLTGHNRHADANGLMARVVYESTQYLNATDVASAALYLQNGFGSRSSQNLTADPKNATPTSSTLPLWQDNCASCHGDDGQGVDDLGPPLAARRSVQVADPSNVIISILHGGFGPATQTRPYPPGMPGFAHQLTDQQIATLTTYIRQTWGNSGSSVQPVDVQRLR